jgi:hypothetical protein
LERDSNFKKLFPLIQYYYQVVNLTHAERIREALKALGPAKPRDIVEWVRRHYPNEPVNENSYRADLMTNGCNHPSQHHFSGAEKFLWYDSMRKTYRIAEDSERNIVLERKIRCSSPDKEPLIGKLSGSGQITIPLRIREEMGFNA